MLRLWKNPEFVRHFRAELRRGRAIVVGSVVLLVCALTILACWGTEKARRDALKGYESYEFSIQMPDGTTRVLPRLSLAEVAAQRSYGWLLLMQFGVLTFWSLLSGAQAISRERERGTWDFQRTTRLSASSLLVGKLLGEPVLAYFILVCSLPITIVLGSIGRVNPVSILSAYLLMIAGALFIGLAGLWLSSLFESRSRGIGLIGALAMYGVFVGTVGLTDSPFPGLAGFSPLLYVLPVLQPTRYEVPVIFGSQVHWLTMSLLLYATFGAWIVLMLVRNLKRDLQDVQLLSRWEAVGCCAFLNFVFYALFNPMRDPELQHAPDFVMFMIAMNGFILFFLGLTMLSTQERLEVGHSSLRSLFSNHGLQWPWLLISAVVSFLMLIWGLYAWEHVLGFEAKTLRQAGLGFLVILVFMVRDVLFIQWCKLTRMRAPMLKGALFICLYYASCAVVFGVISVSSDKAAMAIANIFTPVSPFQTSGPVVPSAFAGIVVQLMLIGFLISGIRNRVRRPLLVAAPAV